MNLLINISKDLRDRKDEKLLLAISGGLDSMALFQVFLHLREHFSLDFSVAYFHHGPTEDSLLLDFRFNAYEFIKKRCAEEKVTFYSNFDGLKPQVFLKSCSKALASEEECREARYLYLNRIREENGFHKIVLAHHQDDLLETRVIRMLRGVGPEGLESMKTVSPNHLRPLLKYSRKELKELMVEKKRGWLEDPSNDDTKILRNWLRKKWFKELEEKKPGSLECLSRSLDLLLENSTQALNFPTECFVGDEVLLSELLCLSDSTKRQVLASYMKGQNLKGYGLSHVNEVLKRLDTEKKSHTFRLLGHSWTVDAGRMSVRKLD